MVFEEIQAQELERTSAKAGQQVVGYDTETETHTNVQAKRDLLALCPHAVGLWKGTGHQTSRMMKPPFGATRTRRWGR
jgi:hypothetical protein